jgi:hypothetical protein
MGFSRSHARRPSAGLGPRFDPERVAAELKRAALSPEDLAAAAGLSHQAACDARLGRQITPTTLMRCLIALNAAPRMRWAHNPDAVRRRLGELWWSQQDLAHRSGVSEATVSTFLHGRSVRSVTRQQIDRALAGSQR